MGGGSGDQFLEGSVLGVSFWRWWNSAWTGEPDDRRGEDSDQYSPEPLSQPASKERVVRPVSVPVAASEELVLITAVVPRPRPSPPPPRKSKPIDIPTRKPVSVPVFDSVPEDKRYWYQ